MNASVFKEDPCSILMGEELNSKAYKTAVAFVPSMRMKVWKPKEGGRDGGEGEGSNEFCYMETDKYSYPTRGVCSADALFDGKVPFIKSAFFDNKLEKTKTFPEDKCVFEIDRTKMTDAALNTFWTKINDLECTGQFVEYQKSNLTLTRELRSLGGQIADQNGIKAQLTRDISSGNATLDQYRLVFGKLQWNIARVTTSNDDLLLKQDQVKAYIATIAADFGRFWASYEASSNLVNNNISNLTARIEGQNSTLDTNLNNIDFIKKQIGYSNLRLTELKSAFSNIQIQYNQLYDINKKLLVTLNAERGNLTGCQTTLADRTRTLEWYRVKVPEIKNEFNENSALNNQCYAESLQCSSNLELCLSNQLALTSSNNALIIKYQKLVDLYDICMGVQSNLVAQSNALGGAIKDWLATHFICDFQVNGLKALDLKKETLQKTCRVADKATYDTTLMSAKALVAQAAADQVTSCTSNKNTLYTSVPIPAESPVDPNQSKMFEAIEASNANVPISHAPKYKKGAYLPASGGDDGWGNQFEFICDDGSYITDFEVWRGDSINGIKVLCQGGKKSEIYGNTNAQRFAVYRDEGFNKLSYWGGWYMNHLGIFDLNGKLIHGDRVQNDGPYACPEGEKLMGIYGGWGGGGKPHVTRLGTICTDMATQQKSCP